jgi:hypothetical protein
LPGPQIRRHELKGSNDFRKPEGAPPQGVKLLGRWTRADLGGGFDLLETDDPKQLAEFSFTWSDLMELKITPVLDDQELEEVFRIR